MEQQLPRITIRTIDIAIDKPRYGNRANWPGSLIDAVVGAVAIKLKAIGLIRIGPPNELNTVEDLAGCALARKRPPAASCKDKPTIALVNRRAIF